MWRGRGSSEKGEYANNNWYLGLIDDRVIFQLFLRHGALTSIRDSFAFLLPSERVGNQGLFPFALG